MKFLELLRDLFTKNSDPAAKRKRDEDRKAKEMAKRLEKNQSSNRG